MLTFQTELKKNQLYKKIPKKYQLKNKNWNWHWNKKIN
jgi:hypothetical protein